MTSSGYARMNRKLDAVAGKYTPSRRDLPTDFLIQQTVLSIPDESWRTMLGLQAITGERNHEVLKTDWTPLARGEYFVHVLDGKTGPREAWVLYPEWVQMFGLHEAKPHTINTEGVGFQALGSIITNKFKDDFKIPFNPYDLRHCWARRSILCGIDPRTAAASLGHSLQEHYKTYNRWFTHHDTEKAYIRMMQDPSRPKPPLDDLKQSLSFGVY